MVSVNKQRRVGTYKSFFRSLKKALSKQQSVSVNKHVPLNTQHRFQVSTKKTLFTQHLVSVKQQIALNRKHPVSVNQHVWVVLAKSVSVNQHAAHNSQHCVPVKQHPARSFTCSLTCCNCSFGSFTILPLYIRSIIAPAGNLCLLYYTSNFQQMRRSALPEKGITSRHAPRSSGYWRGRWEWTPVA